jgi:hypothetical protein
MGITLYHDWFSCPGVICISQILNRGAPVTNEMAETLDKKKIDCVSTE